MPTRFKYAKTLPVSFGLTPAEILLATEAELNSIVSMKHLAPYRSPHNLGAAGRGLNKRVQELKQKLAQRRWGEEYQEDDSTARDKDAGWKGKVRTNSAQQGADGQAGTKKKRMGKKERMKAAKREAEGGDDGDVQPPAKRVKV
jgi:protein KRI1